MVADDGSGNGVNPTRNVLPNDSDVDQGDSLLVTGIAPIADAAATGRLALKAVGVFAVLLVGATIYAFAASLGLHEGRLRFAAHQRHSRHGQVLAVELRRVQLQGEGAIEGGPAGADQVAGGITDLHGGARFATPAQLATGHADHQVGWYCGWRGIDAVDIRCGDRAGCGCVAGRIGGSGLQHFAIDLRRSEGDVEHASRAD